MDTAEVWLAGGFRELWCWVNPIPTTQAEYAYHIAASSRIEKPIYTSVLVLRKVIWNLFLEIWTKWKTFPDWATFISVHYTARSLALAKFLLLVVTRLDQEFCFAKKVSWHYHFIILKDPG